MKHILAFLFSLFLALNFTACSSDSSGSGDDDNQTETGDKVDNQDPNNFPQHPEFEDNDGESTEGEAEEPKDDNEVSQAIKIIGTTPSEDRFDKESSELYIKDTATGLLWEKSGTRENFDHKGAEDYCNNLTTDDKKWRLPNTAELVGIADFSQNESLCGTLRATFESETPILWSSDVDPENPENRLRVNFAFGADIGSESATSSKQVICVSGENNNLGRPLRDFAEHDFTDKDLGRYVEDRNFGLIWEDSNNTLKLNYADAVKHCEELNISGAINWRLPNFNEAYSMVDIKPIEKREVKADTDMMATTTSEESVMAISNEESNGSLVITEADDVTYQEEVTAISVPLPKYPIHSDFKYLGSEGNAEYWSTTNYQGNENEAWTVKFGDGRNSYSDKTKEQYVRCVKDVELD